MGKLIKTFYKELISYLRFNVLLNDPNQDKKSRNVFFVMNSVYLGFAISFLYGVITSAIAYLVDRNAFHQYLQNFFISYNCFITGGLLFGLTLQIYKTQNYIPDLLSKVFGQEKLTENNVFLHHKRTFFSVKASMRIVTIHIILSFVLFYFAKFPYKNKILENLMIIYGCALYGCGVYIGRKAFYVAQMLQSIEDVEFSDDLFTDNKLDGISTYINVITTFTVLAIWFHVNSYYSGPFEYNSQLGNSIKILMFYPAIIAMPVLIVFNYYPKTLLRKLYSKSIDIKIDLLNKELSSKENITEFERIKYLSETDKISRDELKYQLKLALNDLPLIITIVIMLADLAIKKS